MVEAQERPQAALGGQGMGAEEGDDGGVQAQQGEHLGDPGRGDDEAGGEVPLVNLAPVEHPLPGLGLVEELQNPGADAVAEALVFAPFMGSRAPYGETRPEVPPSANFREPV